MRKIRDTVLDVIIIAAICAVVVSNLLRWV